MLNPCLKVLSSYVNSVSECGLFQDFLTVGAKPSRSIVEVRITDNTGCLAISHKNKATNERTKNIVSERAISFLPLRMPSKNIVKQMIR